MGLSLYLRPSSSVIKLLSTIRLITVFLLSIAALGFFLGLYKVLPLNIPMSMADSSTVQLVRFFLKKCAARITYAVYIITKRNGIEIKCQYFFLGKVSFQAHSRNPFF